MINLNIVKCCFQINAADAARGAVRVEARSPTGRVQEMAIGETNGVYTANFTPTEVGEYSESKDICFLS